MNDKKTIFFKPIKYRPNILPNRPNILPKGNIVYSVELSPVNLFFENKSIKGYVTSNISIALAYYKSSLGFYFALGNLKIFANNPEKKITLKENEIIVDTLSKDSLDNLPPYVAQKMKRYSKSNDRLLLCINIDIFVDFLDEQIKRNKIIGNIFSSDLKDILYAISDYVITF